MKHKPASKVQQERFLLGHAESPDWEKAAEQCLQQIGYIPPEANLGFLYVSDSFAGILDYILAHFKEETGISEWVGTVGIGICASGKEYNETSAMAALVTSFDTNDFRILPPMQEHGLPELAGLESWLDGMQHCFGIVHGDPRNAGTPDLIAQLAHHLPQGFLVGGLSSSRGQEPQIAGSVVQGGLSGVVFSDRVPILTGITQGCSPIAGMHRITRCERNIIAEIDGRPALDVFFEDIGEILARDLNRIAGYIFAGLPLDDAKGGDYLVRNLVGVDTKNKLIAVGDLLHSGQSVQFCRRDGATAWEDLRRMLTELKDQLDTTPRGGLYFSCLGRGQNMFGGNSEELREIREHLGDFPLAGFFANGEISHNRLYGYTGVLTLFL